MIAFPPSLIGAPSRSGAQGGRSRPVAAWLFAVGFFVYLMVVVGGATRLTGSGLSITEWAPISGAVPPLSTGAWADAFHRYQASSQYRLINQGISLREFKGLFWWEWGHRLLARWVGVVFGAPFLVFLALRRIPRRLIGRCFVLLGLGGLQGLVGWWMVESGLEGRASVAPERLAVHLSLALLLLASLVWTGLEAWAGEPSHMGRRRDPWRWLSAVFAVAIFFQCLAGALVSGTGAGLIDNDWPLMGGRFVPDDYWQGGLWATLIHGRSAAQFNHRLLAYGLVAAGVALMVLAARPAAGSASVKRLTGVVLALLVVQAGLGVATLRAGDPLALALAHQANAALLLSAAVALAWRSRRLG